MRREDTSNYRRMLEIDREIASGSYPNVPYLMRKLEVSEATILRDIERLRLDFGAEVVYDRTRRGYRYASPSFRLPALLGTEKQIVAAQLMANLLETVRGTPVYSRAVEVFALLSSNIEQDARLDARKLSDRIVFLGMPPVQVEDETWGRIEEAMGENRYVTFDYGKGGTTYRVTLAPWQLVYGAGMWSLYGYNTLYREPRLYNLIAVKNLAVDVRTFELPEDFEYARRAVGNFGRYIGKETYSFKIRLTGGNTVDYVTMYRWAEDQRFERQEDGSTVMSFTSNQYHPVLNWVLERGMYAVPLEPPQLVDEWRKHVAGMAEAAGIFS